MNIYMHEFKMNLKSVITWSVSTALLILLFMSMFSSFAADAALLNEMMSKFPKELLMAFGMVDLDMSTVLGFFALAFVFCQICLAIQAANYGFSLVSVEERDMTADFLLAKPVSRPKILTNKLLAALTSLAVTALVVCLSGYLFIEAFRAGKAYDGKTLALLLLTVPMFQLVFLSVGMVISLLVKRVRNVTPYSMALVFGAYILSAFGSMLGDAKLEIITPFKHFEPNHIVKNGALDLPLVMISVAFVVISVAGSYLLYVRRNIHTAV